MVRAYFETDDGINQPFDKRMNKQRVSKGHLGKGLVRDRVTVVGSM